MTQVALPLSPPSSTGLPHIGDTAPDFSATTTQGKITFSEWQGGSWVVLFSHPADFTPVCTTATVRAVFVIDPQRVIRALIYYPLNTGRNVAEVLRLVEALQTADNFKVALPVNWQSGEKVILPAPRTEAQIENNLKAGEEVVDFYLVKRSLN